MFGFLNLHKPTGVTSRDVVNQVQRLVRPEKVGHTGTLDPLATGVLVVGVGQATRLTEYVQRMPKTYSATFLLGRQSDTQDVDGTVIELAAAPRPSREEIQALLPKFTGEIQQLPPAFSAIQVGGERAYDRARRGVPLELTARPVTIHWIQLRAYEYPTLQLDVHCGSGTYVRTLGSDIAQSLGTDAVMSALVRTGVGNFSLASAIPPAALTRESLPDLLLPPLVALADLPTLKLNPSEAARIAQGLTISQTAPPAGNEIVAVDEAGQLLSILTPTENGALKPMRNFRTSA